MKVYGFNDDAILGAVKHPDEIVEGYAGRLVAHKSINHFNCGSYMRNMVIL